MRIALIVLLIALSSSLYAKSLFTNKDEIVVSQYMDDLKELIVATQKTRGVSLGYINGDESVLLLIYSYRADAKRAMLRLKESTLSSDPQILQRLNALEKSLKELNKKALKLPSYIVFERFNNIISQMLRLAKSVMLKKTTKFSDFSKRASHLMIDVILPLTESMGQLRALGTAATARGSIEDELLREKMKTFIEQILLLEKRLESESKRLAKDYSDKYDIDIDNELTIVYYAIDNYIALSQDELFDLNITYSPIRYFEIATSTIGTVMFLYDTNVKAIASDAKGWF